MVIGSWKIYWNEYASDTYTYGSRISFHSVDDVEFTNELMPPGTVIKTWYSKTNFQANKVEPSLPLIDGEGHYRIETDIDCDEGEQFLLRLVFYDRFDKEVKSEFIWDSVHAFECPRVTYSYRLQLINGGMKHFRFHSVIIRETDDEE